jgi:hypothetical protein
MAESGRGIVSETEGKYSVELFKEGGEGAGHEEIIDRHDNLTVARAIYRGRVSQYPCRLVMLCDRARIREVTGQKRCRDASKEWRRRHPNRGCGRKQVT